MQVTTNKITNFQPISITIVMETQADLKAIQCIAKYSQSVSALVGDTTTERNTIATVLSNIYHKLETE
jgi:hypothetical protein